jgi:hypothetical protein
MQTSVSFERSEVPLVREYHSFAAALVGAGQCTTTIRASSEPSSIVLRVMGTGSSREKRDEVKSSSTFRIPLPAAPHQRTGLRMYAISAAPSLAFAHGAFAAERISTEIRVTQ